MKFIIPIEPLPAPRTSYSKETGKLSGRAIMPKAYRDWRNRANEWLEKWLEKTNYQLVTELLTMPSGNYFKEPKRDSLGHIKELVGKDNTLRIDYKPRSFDPYFKGYEVQVVFILPRTKLDKNGNPRNISRDDTYFPLSNHYGDIDNYLKSTFDLFFQNDTFKYYGLDDRYIQKVTATKIICDEDEDPHIEMEVKLYE